MIDPKNILSRAAAGDVKSPLLLKFNALARQLGITRPTLVKWCNLGILPQPFRLPREDDVNSKLYFRFDEVRKAVAKFGKRAQPSEEDEPAANV